MKPTNDKNIVGAPHVAGLFFILLRNRFHGLLNPDNQNDVIEALDSTSRYLDDLLIIGNAYPENIANQIYPPELQLNKANATDTESPFLDEIFLFQMDLFLLKRYK